MHFFDNILAFYLCPMTTPILRKRTNSALSGEAHIRPVGYDFDNSYISLTRIDTARRGTTGARQNELYTGV